MDGSGSFGHGSDPEARSGRLRRQQRRAHGVVRRPGRPPPDAAHADRRGRRCARSTTTARPPRSREQGDPVLLVTPLAAPGALLRPAPRLLAGRALRRRRPPDVPRGVRRRSRSATATSAWSTGSTRSCPTAIREVVRARRRPAGARGRLEPGRDLRAARPPPTARTCRSRRSPRVGRAVRRQAGAAGRAAAAAAQPHRRPRRDHPALPGRWAGRRSRWCAGPSSCRRSRSWSPSRWRSPRHLDDADFLAQIEAVDRFTANMIAYPGRTFGQLYHRFVKGNALVDRRHRARRPDHLGRRHHGAGAGLRRRHRRHRARSPAVKAVGAAADRRRARCASRSCPAATSACSPAGPRADTHLAGARRVDRRSGPRRRRRAGARGRAARRPRWRRAVRRRPRPKKPAAKKAPRQEAGRRRRPTARPRRPPAKKPPGDRRVGQPGRRSARTRPRRYGSAGSRALSR